MIQADTTSVEEKKTILLRLIDDMTAAAVDHSSQGYLQFLQCRDELITTIDNFMEEDRRLQLFTRSILDKFTEYFRTI